MQKPQIKVVFTNERLITPSGLTIVGGMLGKSDFVKQCNRIPVDKKRSEPQIKDGDILLTYIGLLCQGKTEFEAVREMQDDPEYYKYALGIARSIPSAETLRQRMDDIGSTTRPKILKANVEMFRAHGVEPSALQSGEVPVFSQLVTMLHEMGEIEYEHLFVDGTKIETNANKYSFVWKKSTNKYEARLDEKTARLLPELCNKYGVMAMNLHELLSALEAKVDFPFVHGRGKRKSELQRDVELLRTLAGRKEKYIRYNETFRGRNSFSKTDPDATFMHMKEDHMRNAQLKPGYNVQFGVEGEYITGVDISSERSDQLTLIPLLEAMRGYGADYTDVTADAGYESEENYSWFEAAEKECYIKPQNYERSKTKKFKSNMALRENMAYDADLDEYTCQAGQKLRAKYTSERKSKSGYVAEITHYECDDCSGCPHKKSCTKAKGNRKLQVSKRFVQQRAKSLDRITSKQGILLRINRSIQSEGAFGVIKQDYGFRQFLLRGHKKVRTEILLVAMAYNINKLHAKIQQERTGSQLFKKTSCLTWKKQNISFSDTPLLRPCLFVFACFPRVFHKTCFASISFDTAKGL